MPIPSKKLVTLASLISIELADGSTIEELNTYKNLFSMITCNLGAIIYERITKK